MHHQFITGIQQYQTQIVFILRPALQLTFTSPRRYSSSRSKLFIFSAALAKRLSLPAANTFITVLPAWDVCLAAWQKTSYKRGFGRAFWYASGRNSRFIKLKRFAARTVICHHAALAPNVFVTTCPPASSSFRTWCICSLLPQQKNRR